jgi:beta-glucanase (GH16 family)
MGGEKTVASRNLSLSCLSTNVQCIFLLAVFSLGSSVVSNAQCGGVPPSTTGTVTWTAQWCDEFNGALNSPINSANWTFDTGSGGFGNNELEDYCAPSSNTTPCDSTHPNAYIDGSGHLAIQVRGAAGSDCTTAGGGICTSARLNTSGRQTFHSGRIEANLQIPSQTGLWPAFWNLGAQSGVSWPTVGESDIMENWPKTSLINGPGATGNCSTIHTQLTGGSGKGHCFTFPTGQQIDTAFHTYGQIWSANMIQYYIDDPTKPYFVVTASDLPPGDTWPFSSSANPFFIIMNVAIGGTLGNPTNAGTSSPAPMLVDYVRHYLPSAVPAPQIATPTPITVSAGGVTGNTTTLNLTGTLGTGRVTFSCTTTAPKASCIVTSTDPVNVHTVDFNNSTTASATVAVTTTYYAAAAGMVGSGKWGLASAMTFTLMSLVLLRNRREFRRAFAFSSLALIIAILPSCGGGGYGGGGGGGGGGGNGTPKGSYTITVNAYTASSSDVAAPDTTSTFNLTVN